MINETNLNENLLGVELFLNELYAQVLHELRVDKAPYWFINHSVKCHLSTALKELGYDSKDCHHVTHYFAIPLKEF